MSGDKALEEEILRNLGRQHDAQMGSKPLPKKLVQERVPPPVDAGVYRSIKRFT